MELPIQESVLRELYKRRNIEPTEEDLNKLIHFIGKKLKRIVKASVQYSLHSRFSTLRDDHIFTALQDIGIDVETIQSDYIKNYIPASVFGKIVRIFGDRAASKIATTYPHAKLNPNIRYSKAALNYLQCYIEWLVDNQFPFTSAT